MSVTMASMSTNVTQVHEHASKGTNGVIKGLMGWSAPSVARFDFRSDTLTTPTQSMLDAIANTTLADDVYGEDSTTNEFQKSLAQLAGHENGLLAMSGTMGNQIAIRSHLQFPPHSVLCDARSHLANYEAGGISTLSGAHLICVLPTNKHHLTLEDIQQHAVISDNIHSCPTRVISLENTLNGMITPVTEIKRIAEFARQNDIRLHLDGARIWDAVASSAGSLPEFCGLFDSVSMCFSKGLGAPIGSMIIGSGAFIQQARRIRKMYGGGIRQAGIVSAAARVGVQEGFGLGPTGSGGRLRKCHEIAAMIGKGWKDRGGYLVWPVETNMVWLDLGSIGLSDEDISKISDEEGIVLRSGRIVVHFQICDEALERLEKVLDRLIEQGKLSDNTKEVKQSGIYGR